MDIFGLHSGDDLDLCINGRDYEKLSLSFLNFLNPDLGRSIFSLRPSLSFLQDKVLGSILIQGLGFNFDLRFGVQGCNPD